MRSLAVPVLVVTIVAGACSGNDAPSPGDEVASSPPVAADPTAPTTPALPPLEPVWTAGLGEGSSRVGVDASAGRTGGLTVWAQGGDVVLAGRAEVLAVDAASGAPTWTWRPPKGLELCSAGDPAETGVVGLVAGRKGRCDVLVALDLARGRELWRAELSADVSVYTPDGAPYSAPDRMVVPTECGPTQAFALRRGTPLPDLAVQATGEACDVSTFIREGVAVTMDENGNDDPAVLTTTDLRTGRQLWQTRTRRITDLNGLRSTDPVVLDVIELVGGLDRSVAHAFDERGRPGPPLGLQTWGVSTNTESLGIADDTLVVSYDDSGLGAQHFDGFDAASGDERWLTRTGEAIVLGRYADALVVLGGEDGDLVGLARPSDVRSATLLGGLELDTADAVGWTEDLLLVRAGGALTAYPFPADTGQPLPPLSGMLSAVTPGTVAPDAETGICRAITEDVLLTLGVPEGFPPPAQCDWYLGAAGLVSIDGSVLGDPDAASGRLDDIFENVGDPADAVPLTDVGDEAIVSAERFPRAVTVQLAARHGDLLLVVEVRNQAFTRRTTDADLAAVRDATAEAVRQMFAATPLDEG